MKIDNSHGFPVLIGNKEELLTVADTVIGTVIHKEAAIKFKGEPLIGFMLAEEE